MKKGKRRNNLRLKVALLIILIVILGYIGIFVSSNGLFLQSDKDNDNLIGEFTSFIRPAEPIRLRHLSGEERARVLSKVDLVKEFFLTEQIDEDGDLTGKAFEFPSYSGMGGLVEYTSIKVSPLQAVENVPTRYLFSLTDSLAREINNKLTPSSRWAINVTLDGVEARYSKQGLLSLQMINGVDNVFFKRNLTLAEGEHTIKIELYKPRRVLIDLTVEEGFSYNSPQYTINVRSSESGTDVGGAQRVPAEAEVSESESTSSETAIRGRVSGSVLRADYTGPIVSDNLKLTGQTSVNPRIRHGYTLKLKDPLLSELRSRYTGLPLILGREFNANVKLYVNGVLAEEKQFDNTQHLESSSSGDRAGGVIKIFDFFRELFNKPLAGEATIRLPQTLNLSISKSKDITTFDYTFTEEGVYSLYAVYDISYNDLRDVYRSSILRVTVSEAEEPVSESRINVSLPVSCRFNSDCDAGERCLLGSCVPSCETDSDCTEGYVCSRNVCVLESADESGIGRRLPSGDQPIRLPGTGVSLPAVSDECNTENMQEEETFIGVYGDTILCEDTYLTKPLRIYDNSVFDCKRFDLRLNGSVGGSVGIIIDTGVTATIKNCAFKNFETAISAENINILSLLNNSFDVINAWNVRGNTLYAHKNNVSYGRVSNSVQNLELTENFFADEVKIIGEEGIAFDNILSALNIYDNIIYILTNKGIFVNDKFSASDIQSIANIQSDVILVDSDYNLSNIGNSDGLVRGFYTAEPVLNYNNIPNMLNVKLTSDTQFGDIIYELSWEAVNAIGLASDEFRGVVDEQMLFLRDISEGNSITQRNQLTLTISTHGNELFKKTFDSKTLKSPKSPAIIGGTTSISGYVTPLPTDSTLIPERKLVMNLREPACLSPKIDRFMINPYLYTGRELPEGPFGEWISSMSRIGMFYEIMTNKNIEICEGDYNIMPSERLAFGSSMITIKGDDSVSVECNGANLNYNLGPIIFADNNEKVTLNNCNLNGNTSVWINTPLVEFRNSSITIPRLWFTTFNLSVEDSDEWNDVFDRTGEIANLYDTSLITEEIISGDGNQVNQYWSVNAKVINEFGPISDQIVTFKSIISDEEEIPIVRFSRSTDEQGKTDAVELLSKRFLPAADRSVSEELFLWRLFVERGGETYSRTATFTDITEVLFDLSLSSGRVCDSNDDCETGFICDTDTEVCIAESGLECSTDTVLEDCGAGFECTDNTCQEIVGCVPECGSGEVCLGRECITPECTEDDNCEEDEICDDDYECRQVECKVNNDCSGDEVCNSDYECVECTSDSHCADGFECRNYQCAEERTDDTGTGGGGTGTGGGDADEVCSPVDFTECLSRAQDAECKSYTTGQHKIVQCEVTEACNLDDNLGYVRYSCDPSRYSLSILSKLPGEIHLRAGEQPPARGALPVVEPRQPSLPPKIPPQKIEEPQTVKREISLWWLLLFIIPALAVLGYALSQQYYKGKGGEGVSFTDQQKVPEKGEQGKLNSYVNDALRRGQNKNKINADLLEVGWSQKQIDEAFSHKLLAKHAGKQLADYIKYYKSRGFTTEEIKDSLLKAGWEKEVVDKYLS